MKEFLVPRYLYVYEHEMTKKFVFLFQFETTYEKYMINADDNL